MSSNGTVFEDGRARGLAHWCFGRRDFETLSLGNISGRLLAIRVRCDSRARNSALDGSQLVAVVAAGWMDGWMEKAVGGIRAVCARLVIDYGPARRVPASARVEDAGWKCSDAVVLLRRDEKGRA